MRWLLALAALACARAATAPSFAIVNDRFQKDGASFQIISGRCALPSKSSTTLVTKKMQEPLPRPCAAQHTLLPNTPVAVVRPPACLCRLGTLGTLCARKSMPAACAQGGPDTAAQGHGPEHNPGASSLSARCVLELCGQKSASVCLSHTRPGRVVGTRLTWQHRGAQAGPASHQRRPGWCRQRALPALLSA